MSFVFEQVQRHGRERGDRVAIAHRRIDGSYDQTTWSELAFAARRFTHAFAASTSAGQIIPLCLGKSADCVAAMLGAMAAGRAFSCLNQKLRPPQVARILSETAAPFALIDAAGLMALKSAFAEDSAITRTPWWLIKGSAFAAGNQRMADQLAARTSVIDWPGGVAAAMDAQVASVADGSDRVGCCLFTSGSTGTPKGVLISTGDLLNRARAEIDWYGLSSEDVLLSILPFSFDVGLNQLLTAMLSGCQLVVLDSWLAKDILTTTAQRKVTGISAVPSIWLDFMTLGAKFDTAGEHASLRYITVSGGDMSEKHLSQLPSVAPGAGIFKTYGQTEAFRATSLKPDQYAAKTRSVGRAFAGVTVYTVREDGTRAAVGESGEVVHTGLGVMMGYLGGQDPQNKLRPNPFKSEADPSPMAIFTGDSGYLDEEGFLFLSGRRDDMIKVQGNRVYPAEIRDQLLAIDGVAQAEVVPVKVGDQTRLSAFIIAAAGKSLAVPALKMAMAARAPSYMVPEVIVLKSEYPKTASGKPDRPALAQEALTLFDAGAKA